MGILIIKSMRLHAFFVYIRYLLNFLYYRYKHFVYSVIINEIIFNL